MKIPGDRVKIDRNPGVNFNYSQHVRRSGNFSEKIK